MILTNKSSLNLRGLRDDGRMSLPVLERIRGSVNCCFSWVVELSDLGAAVDSLSEASLEKQAEGPLGWHSVCGDLTIARCTGASDSSGPFSASAEGVVTSALAGEVSARGGGGTGLHVWFTEFSNAAMVVVAWYGVLKKSGSNRGMVRALTVESGSGGCRRAALDLRRLEKKGLHFIVFSLNFCWL